MNQSIVKVIETIAAEVLAISQSLFDSNEIGINKKTGRNTLKKSILKDSIKVDTHYNGDSIVIETLFDNYISFIENGRKPRTGKQPPIDALRDWALENNIPTDNSTLFLISRAIWRDGQEPRPILASLEKEVERRMENEWADKLLEAIMEELNKYFE